MTIANTIVRNIVNIPGWSTRRKIIVFESDDWGSIRMSSRQDRDLLIRKGFPLEGQPFNMLDALESNDDLTALYSVLRKYKDATGRHPVFTAISIVGNPDFEKIKEDKYQQYHFETVTKTLDRYPNRDKVIELYKSGISERLFHPLFHGREHLNVQRWLKVLQNGNKAALTTFDHGVTAIHIGPNHEFIGDFQAAFDLDSLADLPYMNTVLAEGLDVFKKLWGYKSTYFVPTNGPFNNSLEKTLAENGIKYLLAERRQKEPLGNAQYRTHFHYLGKRNKLDQIYLTRNAMFEPVLKTIGQNTTAVEDCMKGIERAFRWGKPAIVSTHRINYIGSLEEKNRGNNLKLLENLLAKITKRWPEAEFMTSAELGDLIQQSQKQ